jgi:hypothetical protein
MRKKSKDVTTAEQYVANLRLIPNEEKVEWLRRYGEYKADFQQNDSAGRSLRISVFEFENTKWWTHLRDGEIIEVLEV